MKLSQKYTEFRKLARRTAAALFFSLGLAYAQGMAMNQQINSNNPAYTAVMDSIFANSFSSFSTDRHGMDSVFAKVKANGFTIVKTSYPKVVEYGSAADAFSNETYDYASDPFNCNIYRIIKNGVVVAHIVEKEIKRDLMNEFGQPDPFNYSIDIEISIFFASTEEGKKLKVVLGF